MVVEVIIKRNGVVAERKIIDPCKVKPITISNKIRNFLEKIELGEIHQSCIGAKTEEAVIWGRLDRRCYRLAGKFPCRKSWKRSNKAAARQWAWHEGR